MKAVSIVAAAVVVFTATIALALRRRPTISP